MFATEAKELTDVPYSTVALTDSFMPLMVIVPDVVLKLVDTLERFGVFEGVVSDTVKFNKYLFMFPLVSTTVNVILYIPFRRCSTLLAVQVVPDKSIDLLAVAGMLESFIW